LCREKTQKSAFATSFSKMSSSLLKATHKRLGKWMPKASQMIDSSLLSEDFKAAD